MLMNLKFYEFKILSLPVSESNSVCFKDLSDSHNPNNFIICAPTLVDCPECNESGTITVTCSAGTIEHDSF